MVIRQADVYRVQSSSLRTGVKEIVTLLVNSKKHGEAVMYTTFESPRDHGIKPRQNSRDVYGWLSRPYADTPDRYLESPPQTSGFGTPHPCRKPWIFETQTPLCCGSPLLSQPDMFGLHCGVGVLTACHGKDITVPLSWRPARADHGQGATRPEHPADMALSGQRGLWINGSGMSSARVERG